MFTLGLGGVTLTLETSGCSSFDLNCTQHRFDCVEHFRTDTFQGKIPFNQKCSYLWQCPVDIQYFVMMTGHCVQRRAWAAEREKITTFTWKKRGWWPSIFYKALLVPEVGIEKDCIWKCFKSQYHVRENMSWTVVQHCVSCISSSNPEMFTSSWLWAPSPYTIKSHG